MFLVSASASVIWCIYKKHFVYKISILNSEYSQIFVKKEEQEKVKYLFVSGYSCAGARRLHRSDEYGLVVLFFLVYVLLFSAPC